ncbi:MAG: hypothetical protein WCK85_11640 [Chlorobium sp.]
MIPLRGENCAHLCGYLCDIETVSIMLPGTFVSIEIMEVTIFSLDKHFGMIPLYGEN